MDINFVKAQFEMAKEASHLSETIVIDINTIEWLIEQAEMIGNLQEENQELKQSFKLRGKKIIKLQNELIEQSKFYEDLLQKWDEEKENLEKGV